VEDRGTKTDKPQGRKISEKPVRPAEGQRRPVRPAEGQKRPVRPAEGQKRPVRPAEGQKRPVRPAEGQKRPARPAEGQKRPARPAEGQKRPVRPAEGHNSNDRSPNNKTKKEKTVEWLLKMLGYFLCTILLGVGIITIAYIARMNVVPTKYIVIFAIILLIIIIVFFVLQRWKIPGIVAKALSFIISVLMIIACFYLDYTYKQVQTMLDVDTKIDNVEIYVLKEDPAQELEDARDYTFGILTVQDRKNTDITLEDINDQVGKEVSVAQYDSVINLIQALYDKEVGCIILNSAYIGFVSEDENYKDFENRVRSIGKKEIETVVDKNKQDKDYLKSGEHVFTVYISGVDTRSVANVNSNSDVNIILTVNTDTNQILMISTPRDYYVPLSISDGVRDKLTHAGGYGIDVSKDTLAMLYGVDIDHYVRINFSGFKKIIDELQGITVYSEQSFSWDGYSFSSGYNDLRGEAALAFARCRKTLSGGDRQRGKNQMAVIEAVINKMLSKDMLMNYKDVLNAVSDSMITDMSYDEISDLVKMQLEENKSWEIMKFSVDGYDAMDVTYSIGNMAVYVMKPNEETVEQAREYLKKMYAGEKIHIEAGE